ILQSKLFALGNAKGFCEARGLFDELVVLHGPGSVVQTCRSEQRAESPSEGREAIVGVEEGIFRERKEAVQPQHIQRVISADRNLNSGHGPAELDSSGTVKHAVCCAKKQRLGGAQPVGGKKSRDRGKKGRSFGAVGERKAVFSVASHEKICARGRSGISCRAARRRPCCYRVGTQLTGAKPAHEFIA